ncbi:MAG: conserved phage C-terminal domain-containing protein [Aliarcobacter butzleri]|nr:conserved phage C-terminal domain-containing protein [Aliarcobacter butzleri]
MFDLDVIDTDVFIEMPTGARLLYYDLGMRADDDGFVASPKKIMKMTNANEDDLKVLMTKQFIIPFDSGICVIRHWRLNNYLRNDRYKKTIYDKEKQMLTTDDNGVYSLGIPNDNQKLTNGIHRIEENRIDKISKDNIYADDINEIIKYLNEILKTNYKTNTPKNRALIITRLKEGFDIDDFKKVVDIKHQEWKNTEWEKFLRPSTLFGNNFEQYLNQKNNKKIEKRILDVPDWFDETFEKEEVIYTEEEKRIRDEIIRGN